MLEHLQALRAIDVAIISNYDLRQRLQVLKQISEQLRVDAVVILLMDLDGQHLEYGASCGSHSSNAALYPIAPRRRHRRRAGQQSQILTSPSWTDPRNAGIFPVSCPGGVSQLLCRSSHRQACRACSRSSYCTILSPDAEWMGFLEALAGQAAIAIQNTTLFERLAAHECGAFRSL